MLKRGDVVKVAEEMPSHMVHFRAGGEAIILDVGGATERLNGRKIANYGIMFCNDGAEHWWYDENLLTFARYGGESEIHRIMDERTARQTVESDLQWICSHWATVRERTPSATMLKLMSLLGVTEPWGRNGEGICYYENQEATYSILDPMLRECNGDVAAFLARKDKWMTENHVPSRNVQFDIL